MDFGYYNMDCMDGMKYFPDGYFDLAIVDPPYGLHEHGGKNRNTYVKQKNGTKTYVKDGQYENRGWDNEPPLWNTSRNCFGYPEIRLYGDAITLILLWLVVLSYGINAMMVLTSRMQRWHSAV